LLLIVELVALALLGRSPGDEIQFGSEPSTSVSSLRRNTTQLSRYRPQLDGGWPGMADAVVVFLLDAVVVVREPFDDPRVGAVSAFVGAFEYLVDGGAVCLPEGVRGKNPPG
jgi:hypothetical protein